MPTIPHSEQHFTGGLPYFFTATTASALLPSIASTLVALFAFGAVKGRYTTGDPLRSAVQTLVIGSLAAAAAFGLARLFG